MPLEIAVSSSGVISPATALFCAEAAAGCLAGLGGDRLLRLPDCRRCRGENHEKFGSCVHLLASSASRL
jgi:hypothetical protein